MCLRTHEKVTQLVSTAIISNNGANVISRPCFAPLFHLMVSSLRGTDWFRLVVRLYLYEYVLWFCRHSIQIYIIGLCLLKRHVSVVTSGPLAGIWPSQREELPRVSAGAARDATHQHEVRLCQGGFTVSVSTVFYNKQITKQHYIKPSWFRRAYYFWP